jgi:hypothetical protein
MSKEPKSEPQATEPPTEPLRSGSINEPPGSNVLGREPPDPHTLTSLDPSEAAIGDPDVTLTVTGTNFKDGAQIVFNGGPEPTTFVSDTELTTVVKPSTAGVAGTFPVTVVQQGFTVEPPLEFTFTEPAARSRRR